MSASFNIRLPALSALIREQDVADFLGPDHAPSTVRVLETSADMIPILERHAARQFAAPVEEVAS